MFTRFEKIMNLTLFVYIVGGIIFLQTQIIPGAEGATSLTYAGYPLYIESTCVADLMDGHYTIFRKSGGNTYVIYHQRGDKDFMFIVVPRVTDDLIKRSPEERFTVFNGRIVTPPEGHAFRAT